MGSRMAAAQCYADEGSGSTCGVCRLQELAELFPGDSCLLEDVAYGSGGEVARVESDHRVPRRVVPVSQKVMAAFDADNVEARPSQSGEHLPRGN